MASYRDPRTGRFVTKARFDQIARQVERAEQRARDRAQRAFETREEARPGSARERGATRRLRAATRERQHVERQRESVREQRRPREPVSAGWEVGIDYKSAQFGRGHAAGHDVMVNLRIRRTDGEPMTRDEAIAAFRDYRASQAMPPGYEFSSVAWRRPHSHWRSGGESDADSFYAIISTTPLAGFRFGGLSEDEL